MSFSVSSTDDLSSFCTPFLDMKLNLHIELLVNVEAGSSPQKLSDIVNEFVDNDTYSKQCILEGEKLALWLFLEKIKAKLQESGGDASDTENYIDKVTQAREREYQKGKGKFSN